jgi:YegS/Rv2252/BmrU family lipid kinase
VVKGVIMKTFVVANPKAAGGKVAKKWAELYLSISSSLGNTTLRFTGHQGHATELVRQAIHDGYERIAVVGGDGSINDGVNGFFDDSGEQINPEAILAIIPAGTGGDFSRSIGMSDVNPEQALRSASVRPVDLGRMRLSDGKGGEHTRYFMNIASFGSTAAIMDKINSAPKILPGKATYFWGSIKGLMTYQNQRVRLRVDDVFDEELLVNSVAVANGRYFGGSMKIAPEARLTDGLLDVIIVGDVSLGEFLRSNKKIYKGEHLALKPFTFLRGKEVIAEPVDYDPVLVEADGERPGQLPARFDLVPESIRLWAPWDRAEAG